MIKIVICLLLSALSFKSFADVRLAVDVGVASVDFSKGDTFLGNSSVDAFSAAGYVGYVTQNQLILDIGISNQSNDILFGTLDNLRMTTYEVMAGYLLTYHRFYLEPKIGCAKWDINLTEGKFLNPGEEQKVKDSGYDPLAMLTIGYRFFDSFGFSVSYKYQDFAYGKAEWTVLGFDFAI